MNQTFLDGWVGREDHDSMTRAAIYARFSSDRQNDRSIEDQVRLCRERAEAQGWVVADVHADYAISGALRDRPGLNALLKQVAAGSVNVVLVEDIDRISRDQEHMAGIRKRLSFAGVALHTLSGETSKIEVAVKSMIAEAYLDDLARKTKRGQRGQVERGRMVASPGYGYQPDRTPGPDGLPEPGRWMLDQKEAAVIRRIFADYVAGASPRKIAAALNAEAVPSPRGGEWNASTINGNAARGNGILHNRLYIGEVVWNRQSFAKDPDSGRRRSRLNPKSEWIIRQAPDLRIIDDATWELAQARKAGFEGVKVAHRRRPKHLLSGLVVCGCCGAPFTLSGSGRLRCSSRIERGTCDNARTIKMDTIEARVLDGLKGKLVAPDLVEAFMREYDSERRRRRSELLGRRAELEAETVQLDAKIGNLVGAIAAGASSPAIIAQLNELEARKVQIAGQLAEEDPGNVVAFPPVVADRYRQMLDRLQECMNDCRANVREASISAIRALITKVTVFPGAKRGEVAIELEGDLAVVMQIARLADRAGDMESMAMVVAGARIIHSHTSPRIRAFL